MLRLPAVNISYTQVGASPYILAAMSRDIVAEIVRRALEPQAAAIGEAVPDESPIEERLRLLRNSLEATRARLNRQDLELARLREQVSGYTSAVDEAQQRLRAIETQGWALRSAAPPPQPRPKPQAVSVPVTAPVPAAVLPAPRPEPVAAIVRAPARSWATALPYAALALASMTAAFLATRPQAPRPRLSINAVPPPMAQTVREASEAVSTIADDLGNADILSLVYSYVPPGSARNVRDLLSQQIESAPGSPWVFARVDEKTTLVSFRPRGDEAAAYEFVVDPASKLVSPSPETLRNLAGITVASAR